MTKSDGLIQRFRKRLEGFFLSADDAIISMINRLKSENFTFHELGILLVIGAIVNIYFLANFSLSIDDEMAAVRENADIWIGQGRWTVYLIEQFLFPQPAIPYAPYIVLIVCLAISYALITRAHNYPTNWKTYACYPLFCAFPTWWFISEFYSNVPAVGIGVLLVSISVYLTYINSRSDCLIGTRSFGTSVAIVILLACAVGAYQSLILLYLCLAMGITLIKLMRSNENLHMLIMQARLRMIQVCLLTAASLMLYAIINYATQQISGTQNDPYIGSFVNKDLILQAPLYLIASVIGKIWQVYSGATAIFGVDMPLASVLLVLATLSIVFANSNKALLSLFLWVCILTIPFALHFLSGADMPIRTMLSLAYVTWLMGMILLSQKSTLVVLTGIIVVGLYQLQIIGVTSQYMASATITQAHDGMLAADIYRRIGELSENFDRNKSFEIDVYGHKNINTVYAKSFSSTMQGSFFDWDKGKLLRMVTYMKVMGYQNINMAGEAERRAMTPLFQNMPAWPAAGSVKKVGERYLVKLSQDTDRIHASFR
jgi:hypothetical protein